MMLFSSVLFQMSCRTQKDTALHELHSHVTTTIDSLYHNTGEPFLALIEKGDSIKLRQHFLHCRNLYKQMELAAEYFMPGTAKAINGAAVPEVEVEENKENEPTGLQVVETFLFPEYNANEKEEFIRAVKNLHASVYRANQIWETTTPTKTQWIEATYFELIRIATMGITGFDTPGSLTSIQESELAMQFIKQVWLSLGGNPEESLVFDKCLNELKDAPGFDKFNRANFLKGPWQQAFAAVSKWRKSSVNGDKRQAISHSATSLFGEGFLDLNFFMPDSTRMAEGKVAIGRQLFYDTRLSNNGKFSCATCHQPDKYFTDQVALSDNIHGNKLPRNTPSLVNAAFQTAYFWDMRVLNLEMQAKAVIDNSFEMHGSLEAVATKLNEDKALVEQCRKFYNNPTLTISPSLVTSLLASYQRTLVDFNSDFDNYMTGKQAGIDSNVIAGFNLFMGKAKCATCHFPPTFAGLVPPYFDKMESEVIGVAADKQNKKLDPDEGRFVIHPVEAFRHAFRTPTVRNAAHTFPYMHNGAYSTLEEVVDFYNKGGGAGLGLDVPNQTLPPDALNLTATEKMQLVTFMQSLSSKAVAK